MISSFLYIAYSSLLGFTVLRQFTGKLTLGEQIVWSTIGPLLQTFLIFLLALLLPQQDAAIILGVLLSGTYASYYWSLDRNRSALARDWKSAKKALTKQSIWPVAAVAIPWLTYAIFTVPLLLFYRDGDLIAGWINVWGDWAVHLRSSTFFAQHTQLTLENPIYSGTRFHYPYLSAYFSALLQRMNIDMAASLVWPTFYFFSFLPFQLYAFSLRLTSNRLAGVFFTYIVLLAGGGGVIHLINDIINGNYRWATDPIKPLLYTDWGRVEGLSNNRGIWFMNFIMSEFVPQRAFLMGIAPTLFILQTAFTSLLGKPDNQITKQLTLAGLLYGLLPLIHTHSFVAISLVLPVFLLATSVKLPNLRRTWRSYILPLVYFMLPAVALGSLLLFGFVFDGNDSFIKPLAWWLPQTDSPANPLTFWLWNAGPILILMPIAWFKLPKHRPLLLAAAGLWLAGNFVRWQPWQYDNLKILTYWYILAAAPVSLWLANLSKPYMVAQIIILVLLTGAGLNDALAVTRSAQAGGIRMATKLDLGFAGAVNEATKQNEEALILASTSHDNPLSLASGRQIYMGYEGWLWTYGLGYSDRLAEITSMYQGTDAGFALIKEKKIDYIAIGPQERSRFSANEKALRERFPVAVDYGGYILLSTKH